MPRVRMVTSVAGVDFEYHTGDEVDMSPDGARQAVEGGWAEYVRGVSPETPERRSPRPETTDLRRRRPRSGSR